ncbi:MAG: efflux RND transporter permease subunit [Candidatus Cloacimonetes bacterium]|nr:efflux RND transporter permease subunit [Candidatus Cloacimonadota bacterium]
MFLSKLSINRPVMVTVGLLILLIFGGMAYMSLSLNLMPSADIPFVTIQTVYPGAGPAETEAQLTKRIEDAVSTISKIDYIDSYSMDNVSLVMIAFELGKDVDVAMAEVKQKVDAITMYFPTDAEKPSVDKIEMGSESIMEIILTGNFSPLELFEIADKQLNEKFSQIEGVAKVDITGGQEREIQVELDDKTVIENMISLPQLTQILAAQNMNMPGGQFQQEDQEYSVRLEGEFDKVETLNQLDIPTAFGVKKLRQIANVTDSGKPVRKRSIYYNNIEKFRNENVVKLAITKTSNGNPVEIATEVKKAMKNIKKDLPEGSELKIIDDTTDYIRGSIDDTMTNVLLGILFTGLVLLFFLHDIRSTIIVALAMPTAIISTFLFLQWFGFSLNMLTLMGLSTSVGVLVANSVVVLENIFRHKEMGNTRREAADKGTSEVTVAVFASTLTNVVVFVPLAMMDTIVGQFLKEFALTVTFATILSLVVSFTLTPMLASLILPEKMKKKNAIGDKIEKMFHTWERSYQKSLAVVLKNKKVSALVGVAAAVLFILTMVIVGPTLGFELFPNTDEGNIKIEFDLPIGYNLSQTAQMYDTIENIIIAHPEVEQVFATLGSQGMVDESVNLASMNATLVDVTKRDRSSYEMVDVFIEELSVIPNVDIRVSASSSSGGGQSPIDFYLQGYDTEILSVLSEEFIINAREIDGLINFDSNMKSGKPEITLYPKRKELAASGLTIYDLALTLRSAVEGLTATKYREKGEEYDIVVSLNTESVNSPEEIRNIPIVSPRGVFRLSQLADIDFTEGTTKIVHRDKVKSAQFTGGVATGYAQGDIMQKITQLQETTELPNGYSFIWGGMSEMMEENNREMGKAFFIAILLTYLLLAALLESFAKPLLILGTLPLALIGVLLALFIFDINMGMMSMMGVIMLIGIVVNAAILLLDYTELLRKQGKSTKEALLEACPTKLKPILMSAIAIIFGMLPMAMGIGEFAAEMRIPLGVVSIGGIIVSTLMTLYVIPALYYLTNKKYIKAEEKV